MKTRPKAKTRLQKTATSGGISDAATLSVRLTAAEREMLAEAAALRGWTPTNLLRVAALERAAQILNTSRPTKLNFARVAAHLATVLSGPRGIEAQFENEPVQRLSLEDISNLNEDVSRWIYPEPLSADQMHSLREAVRLGGPDFLAHVLAECARLQEPADPAQALPDPIDPDTFS